MSDAPIIVFHVRGWGERVQRACEHAMEQAEMHCPDSYMVDGISFGTVEPEYEDFKTDDNVVERRVTEWEVDAIVRAAPKQRRSRT